VTLSAEFRRYCEGVGQQRRDHAEANNLNQGTKRKDPVWKKQQDLLGARGEGAAWQWMGRHPTVWHHTQVRDMKNTPDLTTVVGSLVIDVKTIPTPGRTLIVPNLHEGWIYLLVAEDHAQHIIQGWATAEEVSQFPIVEMERGRPAPTMPHKDKGSLHPPDDLLKMAGLLLPQQPQPEDAAKLARAAYWARPGDDTMRAWLDTMNFEGGQGRHLMGQVASFEGGEG
jgi:hypothetical protein